jgi:hypothetical protein
MPCDDPSSYCEAGAENAIKVPIGWQSHTIITVDQNFASPTAGAAVKYQELMVGAKECGGSEFFCVDGVRHEVRLGFYSVGGSGNMSHAAEAVCEPGFFCTKGIRKKCTIGHYCPENSDQETPCGGAEYYCDTPGLTERKPVSERYYSTPEAKSQEQNRTGQFPCTDGYYCSKGKRVACPAGSYCKGGVRKVARPGYYAFGAETEVPCACPAPSARLQLGATTCNETLYYCEGGLRREIERGQLPVAVGGDAKRVTTFRRCSERHDCTSGEEEPCPLGHGCAQGVPIKCEQGFVGKEGKCDACIVGRYIGTRAAGAAKDCVDCPDTRAVDCTSQAGIRKFRNGWWRNTSDPTTEHNTLRFHRCLQESSCNVENSTGAVTCGSGIDPSAGPLCAACSTGFTRSGQACAECASGPMIKLLGAILALAALAFVFVLCRKSLHTDFEGASMAVLRIGLNYGLMTNVLAHSHVDWGSTLRFMFSMQSVASGGAGLAVNLFDCSGVNFVKQMMFIEFAGPAVVALLPASLIMVWKLVMRYKGLPSDVLWGVRPLHVYVNGLIGLVFMVWAEFIQSLIRGTHFSCYEVEAGDFYAFTDFRQKCEGAEWLFTASIAYVELLLVVPAVPLLTLWFLRRNESKLTAPEFRRRFLFIYGGYRQGCEAWEVVVMARKLLLALVVATCRDPLLQIFCMQIVVAGALTLQTSHRPYINAREQLVETCSLCVIMALLVCGQGLSMVQDPQLLVALHVVVCIINVGAVMMFCSFFIHELHLKKQRTRANTVAEGERDSRGTKWEDVDVDHEGSFGNLHMTQFASNPVVDQPQSQPTLGAGLAAVEQGPDKAGWDMFTGGKSDEMVVPASNPLFSHHGALLHTMQEHKPGAAQEQTLEAKL